MQEIKEIAAGINTLGKVYLKVYLKKLDYYFKMGKDSEKTRKEFVEFTKKVWVQEVTSEDFGSLLYQNIRKVIEIEQQYGKIKNKYHILYRELKIENTKKIHKSVMIMVGIILIISIINSKIIFIKRKKQCFFRLFK